MSTRLRVVVDRDECFSFGRCVEALPSVFVWDDEAKPVIQPFDSDVVALDALRETVESCPRMALSLIDDDGRTVAP